MDKQINVGDLVQVIRPVECGCEDAYMGAIFLVERVRQSMRPWCMDCGAKVTASPVAVHDGFLFEVSRLKRIRPLDELESEKRDEEITA